MNPSSPSDKGDIAEGSEDVPLGIMDAVAVIVDAQRTLDFLVSHTMDSFVEDIVDEFETGDLTARSVKEARDSFAQRVAQTTQGLLVEFDTVHTPPVATGDASSVLASASCLNDKTLDSIGVAMLRKGMFVKFRRLYDMASSHRTPTTEHVEAAVESGSLECVTMFIAAFPVVRDSGDERKHCTKRTLDHVLLAACTENQADIFYDALESGADLSRADPSQLECALESVAGSGNMHMMKRIAEVDVKLITGDNNTITCLRAACSSGHQAMVLYLLELHGDAFDCSVANVWFVSACGSGNMTLIRHLESLGFHVGANLYTCMASACIRDHLQVCEYIIKFDRLAMTCNALHSFVAEAARSGSERVLRFLISTYENTGAWQNGFVNVALRKACKYGHLRVVRFIVEEKPSHVTQTEMAQAMRLTGHPIREHIHAYLSSKLHLFQDSINIAVPSADPYTVYTCANLKHTGGVTSSSFVGRP